MRSVPRSLDVAREDFSRSLSPRPLRVTSVTASAAAGGLSSTHAIACAGSSAGMMPSSRESSRNALERRVVGDGLVAHAAAVAQVGVLGPDTRVVEAGRDRVGLDDLAVLVLEHRRERAVQDAGLARRRATRRACRSRSPLPRPRRRSARRPRRRGRRRRSRSRCCRRRRRRRRGPAAARSPRRTCARASSPITRWRSRTSAG